MDRKQEQKLKDRNAKLRKELTRRNRELEIEAALEKVRVRTMDMRNSSELAETSAILFQQLSDLGIKIIGSGVGIFDEANEAVELWLTTISAKKEVVRILDYVNIHIHPVFENSIPARRQKKPYGLTVLKGDDVKQYYQTMSTYMALPKQKKYNPEEYFYSFFFLQGSLNVITAQALTEEECSVMIRMARVFGLIYTRFLDLQKAEEQARDARLETALERVRSVAMSMRRRDDLSGITETIFTELKSLGFKDLRNTEIILINNDNESLVSYYYSDYGITGVIELNYKTHPTVEAWVHDLKSASDAFVEIIISKDEMANWRKYREEIGYAADPKLDQAETVFYYSYSIGMGGLSISSFASIEEEQIRILERFRNVFHLCYQRYTDIALAEAQAKEAKIEAALERVRSRAMAMHQTNELLDAAELIYKELTGLGISSMAVTYSLMMEDEKNALYYSINPVEGKIPPFPFQFPHTETEVMRRILASWKKQEAFNLIELDEEETVTHQTYIARCILRLLTENNLNMPFSVEAFLAVSPKKAKIYTFNFAQGYVFIIGGARLTSLQEEMVLRFTKVFEMTYRRFLDLKQAEEQAKEAKIEAALERIRARAMAMHSSAELMEVANVLREQMGLLGQPELETSAVHLYEEDADHIISWRAFRLGTEQHGAISKGRMAIPKGSCAFVQEWLTRFHSGASEYTVEVSGAKQKEWYEILFSLAPDVKDAMTHAKTTAEPRYYHFSTFSGGALLMVAIRQPSEESIYLQRRAAGVFDLAYRRFMDLKQAEAQAKEARIEAALERVRSRAMAMQTSEELNQLIGTVFHELTKLDLALTRCIIMIFDPETKDSRWWMANSEAPDQPNNFLVPYHDHPSYLAYLRQWEDRTVKWEHEISGIDKIAWDDFLFAETELSQLPDFVKAGMRAAGRLLLSVSFNNFGCLHASSLEPLSDEHFDILLRFARVFDLTYTRFNDLKIAEAQAREAKIETALERVRSRTMAMQRSEELQETAAVLFQEFNKLDENPIQITIGIVNEAERVIEFSGTDWGGSGTESNPITMSIDEPTVLKKLFEGWKEQKKSIVVDLSGDELEGWIRYRNSQSGVTVRSEDTGGRRVIGVAFFSKGHVSISTNQSLPAKTINLLERFASVFEGTYTRFQDLKNAEARALEAKIEASLERVRSKTMAMHNSSEVGETVAAMFDEFVKLEIKTIRSGILIIDETNHMEAWAAKSQADAVANLIEGQANLIIGRLDMMIHPALQGTNRAWRNKELMFEYELVGEDLKNYYRSISEARDYPVQYDLDSLPTRQVLTTFFFPEGAVFAFTNDGILEESAKVIKRFAGVFGQTYRRYLDLQKAEAQAREAVIETALEKVRGKAMAMHTSHDLIATAGMVFTELRKLGIRPMRAGVGLQNKENRKVLLYSATSSDEGESLSMSGWAVLDDHPVLMNIHDTWARGEDYFPVMKGDELRSYYEKLTSHFEVPDQAKAGYEHHGYFLSFSEGSFYGWSEQPITDAEIKILNRFRSIIDLTFRRYLELQKSEANAREAIRQASLDRVRAEIASMRTTQDLDHITPLIWRELTTLGIPFVRCGIFLMDETEEQIHTFLTTPDGNAIAAFHLPYLTSNLTDVVNHWRSRKIYVTHWGDQEFSVLADTLVEQKSITTREQYLNALPKDGIYLHYLPFLQGMLYVGNTAALNENDLHLVQSVADAFSTAYARYEDFNKLESAKYQVEKTLSDLKLAQVQLVQSEKMASLGELTAGIAHEIQNPLNFVNNFSEVSKELLDEMKVALDQGDTIDAKQLADNVIQNLEKINHHGKRADSIVKGMLQHSRSSSGQKELIDINALADEYLRLAYHGLRAKDKSFSATFKTDFDTSIGEINILPQDIGRVILNLLTNAFYAVNEKRIQLALNPGSTTYEPLVTVSTRKQESKIEIRVTDNGSGIPQKALEKIFQPFFTTKPTGQGTGLGLSLSYDIVTKSHGGELKVQTTEGVGTTFTIVLPN